MVYYIRDEEGSLIGFKYNNTLYYYIKNMQEDIIGLTDRNDNLLCSYEYDSWSKLISIKDNNGMFINFKTAAEWGKMIVQTATAGVSSAIGHVLDLKSSSSLFNKSMFNSNSKINKKTEERLKTQIQSSKEMKSGVRIDI